MRLRVALCLFLVLLLGACGGKSTTPPPPVVNNPSPTITAISPNTANKGTGAFTLVVSGSGFIATSVVRLNGVDRSTTLQNSGQLSASLTAADISAAGSLPVTVSNPPPGGGVSNAVNLQVTSVPVITSLSPPSAVISSGFVMLVNGFNFSSNSIVRWNGSDRATTFVSATQLSINVTATDVASAGTVNITVFDPNGTSSASTFTILNPAPSIFNVTPTEAITGGADFTLTVNGSNFLPSSAVRWGGSNRTTNYVSSTRLTAQISASDIVASRNVGIDVVNPSPGGGNSNLITFVVSTPNPVPMLTSLNPSSVTVGGISPNGLQLTVDGSNFVNSSTIQWDGGNFSTVFVSNTRLMTNVPNYEASTGKIVNVRVFNPAPAGGTSNTLPFTVQNPQPTLTTVDPATAIAGAAPVRVRVSGSSFVVNSAVQWNGLPRPTTYASNTELQADISSSDLANTGTFPIRVVNPVPGGGASSAIDFTVVPRVTNPQPTLDPITETAPAGWPGFGLEVSGTGFISSTVLRYNGATRATTALSSTRVRGAIPPSDLANASAAAITVENGLPGGGTSNSVGFTVYPVVANVLGALQRISANSTDFQAGNGDSFSPTVSASGRYVAFASAANNLVAGDTNDHLDVFLRDTCAGAAAGCTPTTTRVSLSTAGAEGNGDSSGPSISADGRYVAFESLATNLVAGTNAARLEVYVRDTCTGASGCTPTTVRITPNNGTEDSNYATLSGNARYVSYLVNSPTISEARVADTCIGAPLGCTVAVIDSVELVNNPHLSGNGRYLVFSSNNSSLVAGDTNGFPDIFVRDTCAGVSGCAKTNARVSVGANGEQPTDFSFLPSISTDGRFVVFSSWATNLVTGTESIGHQVYWRDTCLGAPGGCIPTTTRISLSNSGTQARSGGPATGGATVSSDGRYVVFGSNAPLVTEDTNGTFDVFVRDTCFGASGCTTSTRRFSVALNGTQGNDRSDLPVISADGRFVAFQSVATTLGPGIPSGGSGTAKLNLYLARTGRP